ncbi:MAG: hypothetical protein RBT86_09200 [Azospira sp.]|jgi:hypothetical protein|nr:hypothetical protein [Azospira sp.]
MKKAVKIAKEPGKAGRREKRNFRQGDAVGDGATGERDGKCGQGLAIGGCNRLVEKERDDTGKLP